MQIIHFENFFTISGLLCHLDVQLNKRSDSGERISRMDIKSNKCNEKLDDLIFTSEDEITRIKGCATMWHENSNEMSVLLKSFFRMDEDYCAR